MSEERRGGIRSALAWIIFPVVPTLLGGLFYQTLNFSLGDRGGPDPSEWDWGRWAVLIGPLVGYGFLAGATLRLMDEAEPRRIRRWLGKRSLWVAIGPWIGFLSGAALIYLLSTVESWVPEQTRDRIRQSFSASTWGAIGIACLAWAAYGWVLIAFLVLRRARRRGQMSKSLWGGLVAAVAFVGSLFGTFWAITAAWREYFFDKRIMPLLLVATSLGISTGCASQVTYGEVRRRELFQALLTAWLLGTALAWRWWSRSRSRPTP